MSKSTLHHDRDSIAIIALRQILPSYWLFKSPADMHSNKEYSEDLIVEIVNDDERRTVTGVEFGVQNKTDLKVYKNHITVSLGADDVKRLQDLQRLTIIHGYDVKTKISYWIWLNDWYPSHIQEVEMKFKRRKNVAIKISKRNVLNVQAIQAIESRARSSHQIGKYREWIDRASRIYAQDYSIGVYEEASHITAIVNPKHDNAVPVIKPLDELAHSAMIHAIETGKNTLLVGQYEISNIPQMLHPDVGELESVWLIPNTDEATTSYLKFEFFDEQHNLVFCSFFVEMSETEPGTLYSRWEGLDTQQNIQYIIQINKKEGTGEFFIDIDTPTWDAKLLDEYLTLLDKFYNIRKIQVINLKTNQISQINPEFNASLTLEQTAIWRLAKALLTIEDKLRIAISMPKEFHDGDLVCAEWVAEALANGAVKTSAERVVPEGMQLICEDEVSRVKGILNQFESEGNVSITVAPTASNLTIALLDHQLELGMARYNFSKCQILNADKLREILADETISEETTVQIVYDIDRDEVYIVFEKWIDKTSA